MSIPALFKDHKVMKAFRYANHLDFTMDQDPHRTEYLQENYCICGGPYNPLDPSEEEIDYWKHTAASQPTQKRLITCCNILNTLDKDKALIGLFKHIENLCNEATTVIFQVFEGDRRGVGRKTTLGFQRNQKIYEYVDFITPIFGEVARKGNYIIVNR